MQKPFKPIEIIEAWEHHRLRLTMLQSSSRIEDSFFKVPQTPCYNKSGRNNFHSWTPIRPARSGSMASSKLLEGLLGRSLRYPRSFRHPWRSYPARRPRHPQDCLSETLSTLVATPVSPYWLSCCSPLTVLLSNSERRNLVRKSSR